jgi:hypothetical protein
MKNFKMCGIKNLGYLVLLAGITLLSGCNSIMYGKQYRFPTSGEPSAKILLERQIGTRLDIMTFNEAGCYAGYTTIPSSNGIIEAQVVAGKELILTYSQVVGGKQCQIPFSFTPQSGATYILISDSWSENKKGIIPILNHNADYCGIKAYKKLDDQKTIEKIQQLNIKVGFGCLEYLK